MKRAAYEEKFDHEFLRAVRSSDTVWDIGAHVGLYTRKLAEIVGPTGKVVAFEPAAKSIEALRKVVSLYPHVIVVEVALSDHHGEAEFFESDASVTNSLDPSKDSRASHRVTVERADAFLADNPPNVVKIDVEGFEPDVLRGMRNTLQLSTLRAIFIEVHFLELARRKIPHAPAELRSLLEDAGFKIRWIDPSHLVASR